MGGKQPDLGLGTEGAASSAGTPLSLRRSPRPPRVFAEDAAELAAHRAMLDTLKDPLWRAV
jgi:hypothetical protein